jgi:acyl-CoA oxidase
VSAWDADLRNFHVLGCFALSEVAHASNVRGVETTAVYNPATQEFVINSPRDESGKFWIGAAGGSTTHAVVYAQVRGCAIYQATNTLYWMIFALMQLIDHRGKAHGLNAFIVQVRDEHAFEYRRNFGSTAQLRSLVDGSFMPGVVCWDVGPKMGRNGVCNSSCTCLHLITFNKSAA